MTHYEEHAYGSCKIVIHTGDKPYITLNFVATDHSNFFANRFKFSFNKWYIHVSKTIANYQFCLWS